jgi:hypothetical protein
MRSKPSGHTNQSKATQSEKLSKANSASMLTTSVSYPMRSKASGYINQSKAKRQSKAKETYCQKQTQHTCKPHQQVTQCEANQVDASM